METCVMSDFEKVCRICMKFDKTFLSIISFNIIDMIIACASVQIWENDDLPNQICHACFLQLQNTINFKQLCENSDHAFRQIIEQNKINNENDFINIKNEEIEEYARNFSPLDIKDEEIAHNEEESKKSEQNNALEIKNIEKPESNKIQIQTKSEEESDTCEDIEDDDNTTEKFSCEKCNREFKKLWVLGKHMHRIHKVKALKCNQCKLKFYHPLHLKEHQELTHNKLNHTCNKCGIVCLNIYKLKNHECKSNSSKLLQCPRCDKSFDDKRELKYHNKEVHKHVEMKVTCYICGKLVLKASIIKHMKNIHKKRDKITCDKCSKTFISQKTLAAHIKVVHEKEQPARNHLCNICGYATTAPSQLRKHLMVHSSEKPHACDRCDKAYRREDDLKGHIARAHLNIRKYQCTLCTLAFFTKINLTHHVRRHTGEKPHKCEVCGKGFIQKVAMKSHMKIHNLKENLIQS
ncbi:zinc finger protein OZF-like [Chrysoperla carnea]|uniref:zinc finger protein OZF-like n=1 Tax=Chrysoperla carnea TaxID=189513 RepID=UPI001D089CA4|nr:zinc finger protein OZF-like [Chrysoperla carnea]